MCQAVFPPIIRSSKLYTQHRVFVEFFLLLTAIVSELELPAYFIVADCCVCFIQFSFDVSILMCFLLPVWQKKLTHESGKKQKKLDKYLTLCTQF